MHHHRRRWAEAFTLIEMSIVLAIIGIIVGGIYAGTNVLKQSELQTVIADYTKYSAAVAQFNQQYGGMPGDLLDGTNYWGDDNANCADAAVTDGTPGTCNGNGDGAIATTGESFRGWQQLQLAKLIDGNFTGTGAAAVVGTNVPRSRITNAGWSLWNKPATGALANPPVAPDTDKYDPSLSNLLMFGSPATIDAVTLTPGPAITAPEAWQIDKKIDDSLPSTGRTLALKPSPSTITPNCVSGTAYNIADLSVSCSLMMSLTLK
jgi:prepilin-type N-terminal cleavage/methylation domain-containing protein